MPHASLHSRFLVLVVISGLYGARCTPPAEPDKKSSKEKPASSPSIDSTQPTVTQTPASSGSGLATTGITIQCAGSTGPTLIVALNQPVNWTFSAKTASGEAATITSITSAQLPNLTPPTVSFTPTQDKLSGSLIVTAAVGTGTPEQKSFMWETGTGLNSGVGGAGAGAGAGADGGMFGQIFQVLIQKLLSGGLGGLFGGTTGNSGYNPYPGGQCPNVGMQPGSQQPGMGQGGGFPGDQQPGMGQGSGVSGGQSPFNPADPNNTGTGNGGNGVPSGGGASGSGFPPGTGGPLPLPTSSPSGSPSPTATAPATP